MKMLVMLKFSPKHTAEKGQTHVKHCLVKFEVNLAFKGILFMTDVVVPKSKRAILHSSHLGNIG